MPEGNSRLNRSNQQKIKKQIIFFTIAIVVLLFIVFQFGPIVLDKVSSFTGSKKTGLTNSGNEVNTLETPFINVIPEATDSASIKISGTSTYSDATVELYINGSLYDSVPLSSDQSFSFDNVTLTSGGNIIKARVKKGNNVSDFTRDYTVTYAQSDAKLDVSSPTDGQTFGKGDQSITVQGQTDTNNDVTVNGSRAIVDQNGNFSYYMNLQNGDNNLDIIATTPSGKTTEKKITVKYQP